MRFKEAVEKTPSIEACYETGLRALGANSGRVIPENTRALEGSVYLDGCVSRIYPNSPRWDYIIGYNQQAYFVEVHPANTGNVAEMLNKLRWLKSWLQEHGAEINAMKASDKPFRWVATGGIAILKDSSQARKLAQSGLTFPEKITRIK